jgi:hypothetical protein
VKRASIPNRAKISEVTLTKARSDDDEINVRVAFLYEATLIQLVHIICQQHKNKWGRPLNLPLNIMPKYKNTS